MSVESHTLRDEERELLCVSLSDAMTNAWMARNNERYVALLRLYQATNNATAIMLMTLKKER